MFPEEEKNENHVSWVDPTAAWLSCNEDIVLC